MLSSVIFVTVRHVAENRTTGLSLCSPGVEDLAKTELHVFSPGDVLTLPLSRLVRSSWAGISSVATLLFDAERTTRLNAGDAAIKS